MLRRCVDGRRFCGSRLQRLSPLHLSLHTSSPHRPVSEPGWEKNIVLEGEGVDHISKGPVSSHSWVQAFFYWGAFSKHIPNGSEFFPSPGGCKKSFVIWQKFCDYGRDHCETFSELVHINDFKGLWVSKMRQLKKSKDSIDPKKIWKLTKSLFYVYLIHSVSIHFILISISWGINFIHVSLVLWKYQYQN